MNFSMQENITLQSMNTPNVLMLPKAFIHPLYKQEQQRIYCFTRRSTMSTARSSIEATAFLLVASGFKTSTEKILKDFGVNLESNNN